ncbi:MAG: hypothetical protein ABIY50_13410 [Ignavibacteria bacterium]
MKFLILSLCAGLLLSCSKNDNKNLSFTKDTIVNKDTAAGDKEEKNKKTLSKSFYVCDDNISIDLESDKEEALLRIIKSNDTLKKIITKRVQSDSGVIKFSDGANILSIKNDRSKLEENGILIYKDCISYAQLQKLKYEKSDGKLELSLTSFFTKIYFKNEFLKLTQADRIFMYDKVDLNSDGTMEIFVGFNGPQMCTNNGCTFLIMDPSFNILSKFSGVNYPVIISKQTTNGWADLILKSGKFYRKIIYDGKKYPTNVSGSPKTNLERIDIFERVLSQDYSNKKEF